MLLTRGNAAMTDTDRRISTAIGAAGRRGWKWVTGIVVAAFGTLLTGYVSGQFGEALPSTTELACWIQEWSADRPSDDKPVVGPKFTILISRLVRDTDDSQTSHLISSFEQQAALEIVPTCRVLQIEPHGSDAAARMKAEEEGRQWLKKHRADLLIWGEFAPADKILRLQFTGLDDQKAAAASAYKLDDTILPKNFHEVFAAQLVAVALSSIRPATEQAGTPPASVSRSTGR